MPATKGQNVTISCESDGHPEPTYTIYRNDNTSVVSNEKTHTIHSVNFIDAGLYRCEAKNELGNDLSEVKNLTVNRDTNTTPTNNEGKIKNLSLSLVGLLFCIMYELSW